MTRTKDGVSDVAEELLQSADEVCTNIYLLFFLQCLCVLHFTQDAMSLKKTCFSNSNMNTGTKVLLWFCIKFNKYR